MKRLFTRSALLACACLSTLSQSCSKSSANSSNSTQGQVETNLLVGRTLTSTKLEGSNDNGVTWTDITVVAPAARFIFNKDNTYNLSQYGLGSFGPGVTGGFSISADGKILNLVNYQYTLVSVTSGTCVFLDPAANAVVSAKTYVSYIEERFTLN